MKCVIFALVCGLFGQWTVTEGQFNAYKYRFCVPEHFTEACAQMLLETSSTNVNNVNFACEPARDKIDCLEKISKGDADVAPFDPEEIFVAAENFHNDLVVVQEIRNAQKQHDIFRYEAVAVVKNSAHIRDLTDLRKRRSCHTGFGKTSGWQVPIPKLMSLGVIPQKCDLKHTVVEQEIAAVSEFFGQSCVPGAWAPDIETDIELKDRYRNLCDLCENPGYCNKNDSYAGYSGALRCLTEGDGDIAWTKLDVVRDYFGLTSPNSSPRAVAAEYSFLCPDGRSDPINNPFPCIWAGRPWKAFMVNKKMPSQAILNLKDQLQQARHVGALKPNGWFKTVLEFESPDYFAYDQATPIPASVYLAKANYTVTIDRPQCEPKPVIRICVTSELERGKCLAFKMAAYARRIRPELECVLGESPVDCMSKVKNGVADVVSLDAGLVYTAGREFGLHPVLTERYGDLSASYYAVAVVRSNSGIQSVRDLRGKKSCHTGYGRTAGWNMPLQVLLEHHQIHPEECDFPKSIAEYFSESCVPGIKLRENDPYGENPDKLCALCVGQDIALSPVPNYYSGSSVQPAFRGPVSSAGRCAADSSEAFSGYTGAFRCLVEGGGDVAFVKHATVLSNTDGRNSVRWALGLRSEDFRLLCKDGGLMPVDKFRSCHWGRVPAHKVMTSDSKDKYQVENIRLALLKASDIFHPNQVVFRLFGSFQGTQDMLFKDSTTSLNNVPDGSSYLDTLDQDYVRMLEEIRNCNGGSRLSAPCNWIFIGLVTLFLVLSRNY